jgi:hypothetical protein
MKHARMTRLALLAAVVLSGGWPASTAPLPPLDNLLHNSSFEQPQAGAEKLAAGWARYQCGYTRTRERSYAPDISGPWSCRLTGAGGADEKGVGGTNTGLSEGFPDHGSFAATNSIYVASYTQGSIYGAYVTAGYTDGTEKIFSFTLSDAQVKANLGCWKTYRLAFTTDPQKKLKSFTYWCLVWSKGDQKFIGTVYFDEVELRAVADAPGGAALPFALAARALTPPRLDGVGDDACWRQALALSPFVLSGGAEAATEQTQARLAYDEDHLYLFIECRESALSPVLQERAAFKAEQTDHDSNVFSDDVIELFLQPSPEQGLYYHIALNSRGAVYDARCQGEDQFDKSWDSQAQVKTAVGNRSWTLEIALPRARLIADPFAAANCWRVNICREEKPSGEYSCWSPTGGAFHTPARFGLVAFGPPTVGGGAVELGALRKGDNRLQLTVSNAAAGARVVTVTAAVAGASGASEVGRGAARVEFGQGATVDVPYTASSGEGALRYEVSVDGRLVLISPAYPLRSENPFIAHLNVLGGPKVHVIPSFSVVQGEALALPLVLLSAIEPEQFRDAQVTLEVPAFLHLVSPLGGPRRCPSPLRVTEQPTSRDGQPYRRLVLDFGPASVTFARAREERNYVVNPLLFRADYVSDQASQPGASVIAYAVRLNGQSKAEGTVPLSLLPPLARKLPRQIVVCNWPCGSTYYNAFFNRLSPPEQEVIFASWLRTGFNTFNYAGSLAHRYVELGLRTSKGLPGTLDGLCASVPEVATYLRDHPQFQDATREGRTLARAITPARLLEPDCPVRQLLRDYVGKAARQYPILSWDYEVPVARPDSAGFGTTNLVAFRQFAKIPDAVTLTPETIVRDYRPQWVDFRCRQNAAVAGLLQEGIKAANPRCTFFVYSGYQGAHTQETYGINWQYLAPHIDQAWCGYGRPVQQTQDTLRVLGGKPLVGGELAWLGDGHAYDLDEAEVNLLRRLTDCQGGIMVYYDWFEDGRFTAALSRAAAVAADFEPFFREGRRDDALATVQAGGPGNVAVYAHGAERLVVLFGPATGTQDFSVQLKDLPAGAVALDYWTKQPVSVSPLLTANVPAHAVKVIHIRPPDSVIPATPRLLSPIKETVSDWRPLLAWDQDGAADCRYRVEVAADRTFPQPATVVAADLAANTHVITEPLDEDGTYFWRVRAVDALNGRPSAWSPVGQFTLGILEVAVQPAVFSPNADGAYDTVALQAELRHEAPWTVIVADAAGRAIKTVTGQGAQPSASWDGRDIAGKPAPEGRYELRLQVKGRQIAARTVELNRRFGVPNPELERWCSWRPQALEGGMAEQDYHTASGNLSYSLMLTGANPDARAYWSNYRSGTEIPITAGKTCNYSGLVKCDLAAGAQATVSLHFFTREDRWAEIPGLGAEWEGVTATLEGQQDWTRLTVSCQAPPNAAKAVLFFSIKGQGRAWMSAAEFGAQ